MQIGIAHCAAHIVGLHERKSLVQSHGRHPGLGPLEVAAIMGQLDGTSPIATKNQLTVHQSQRL